MKENTRATNLEPHECDIFGKSTKMCTHENIAIHSNLKVTSILMIFLKNS